MKKNILASIALFGVYRTKNLDTYDLVSQYISATIAQKGYSSFSPATLKDDLFELFQIEIPIGVIKSVCKNRVNGLSLNQGVFSCTRIPKDEIEKEYSELNITYDSLFTSLFDFVKSEGKDDYTDEYTDDDIRLMFSDFLVEGGISDSRLNNLFAAFIASHKNDLEVRQKIDLLSSGLISYNGLRYTDNTGDSGSWTDKLTIYLDTEFLFGCAGYNGEYQKTVFNELYNLVKEVNASYRKRSKKGDDLIEIKYLKDTRDVYVSLINSAKGYIESKAAPDPSKQALMKIIQESETIFDVDIHRSTIDSIIKDVYNIGFDDNDYDSFISDPRFVIFDAQTVSKLNDEYNPTNDETTTRKIDYVSRVLTIINGLRSGKPIHVFEKCRYVFLTGSKIGRGASIAASNGDKTVTLATDIDFLVSRLWFKLNKQLVNNKIPVSLDIVSRSQAVLTREVSRKIRDFYCDLVRRDMSEEQKKTLYGNLMSAKEFLQPYNESSTTDVLTFIEYTSIDELLEAQNSLKKRVAEFEKKESELSEVKGELQKVLSQLEEIKKDKNNSTIQFESLQSEYRTSNEKQKRVIKALVVILMVLVIIIVVGLCLFL